jgi:hypothetical protein
LAGTYGRPPDNNPMLMDEPAIKEVSFAADQQVP